jgi:hypothetical protein
MRPAAVAPRIRTLQTRLQHRLEKKYILACLRDALERDPTYKAALLFDPIEDTAYYNEEKSDAALVLDRVKAVFQGTHLRKQHTIDEDTWCLHVVTPLLQLAIILYGRGRFRQESVCVSLLLSSLHPDNIDSRNRSSPPTSPPPPPPAPNPFPSPQNRLLPVLLTPPPSVCQPLQDHLSRPHQPHHPHLHRFRSSLHRYRSQVPLGKSSRCTVADEHLDGGRSA